jgi:glycosyltransferase involved in cell wall biosynthesis
VIATAHGGPLEQVVEGVTGYLVSPSEPQGMSEALERLLCDAELGRALGAAGRARMLTCFSTHRYVSEIEDVYRVLLSERRHTRPRRRTTVTHGEHTR